MKKSLARVVIIGQPNVGKSTLFNRLAGSKQAIISDVANTTRDLVHSSVKWRGKQFELVDTAGLNKSKDPLIKEAMELIDQAIDTAEVIIMVVDGTAPLGEFDRVLSRKILKSKKPVILAVNKADQLKRLQSLDYFARLGIKQVQPIAAISGLGSGDLLDAVTDHLPKPANIKAEAKLKVAILGRPNVGKSSLLNRLSGHQVAITSEVAGTTRDINRADVRYNGRLIEFADTAGLRRPGKIGCDIEYFSSLRTKKAIADSDICLLLIDATELIAAQDQKIAGLVKDAGKGLVLVVSKWDAVSKKDDKTMASYSRRITHHYQFVWWAPLIFTSAATGQNTSDLLKIIMTVSTNRRGHIPTTTLNGIITEATAQQAPAGLKSKRPKIKYATQTGTEPPHFVLFSSYPEQIHFSYLRYIENKLRNSYEFTGTPITIERKNK